MWWAALFSGKNGTMIRNLVTFSIIATVIIIIIVVVINKNKAAKLAAANKAKIIGYEAEITPEKLSYSDSEFENMAAAIDEAIGTWSDDEATIYNVFMKLKTNSDLLKLQAIFGVRSSGHDLFTAIHRNLNNDEIQKINTYLSQHNISIQV